MTPPESPTAPDAPADRFRRVAGRFGERLAAVPADRWDAPAPCEGWDTRDVVRHLVEWVPGFLRGAGVDLPEGPSVDEDPVAAWNALADAIQALLDDPETANREIDAGPPGRMPLGTAIDMIVTGDVLVHTWDLSRAAGLDETIDDPMVGQMLAGMQPIDDMLRTSGHYGPKVAVPDDADDLTKLVAFTGRTP